MTIYTRKMTIQIMSEDWQKSDLLDNKLNAYLHEEGLSLVESYNYNDPKDEKYGFRTVNEVSNKYNVSIDDKQALSFDYRFKAQDVVEMLKSNGFNAEYSTSTTTVTSEKWMPIMGQYVWSNFTLTDGVMRNEGLGPMLHYSDGTVLKTRIYPLFAGQGYELEFKITKVVETISDRKKIEASIVAIPARDMRTIKTIVFASLRRLSVSPLTHVVDCETTVSSDVNYNCSPETVNLVMEEEE